MQIMRDGVVVDLDAAEEAAVLAQQESGRIFTQAAYEAAVVAHLDAVAAERGYSSMLHCASYVGSTVEPWAGEAAAAVAWRDAVWLHVYAMWADPPEPPPTPAELVAGLPVIAWPPSA